MPDSLLRNILFFIGGLIIFIAGVIIYGVILNIREISLKDAMDLKGFEKLNNVSIRVDRTNYTLSVYEGEEHLKTYRAVFGRNHRGIKSSASDRSTPVGKYVICEIDTNHHYNVFMQLNYPNMEDITDALRKGNITQEEYNELSFDLYYGNCPRFNNKLGGNIGIHGIGTLNVIFKNLPFVYNWTDGSIAISDENINELYSVINKGTEVVIHQ